MVSPIEGTAPISTRRSFGSQDRAPRSLPRRLAADGASARRQDQLPQPAGWRAGPLVDGGVRKPLAASHANGARRARTGRRVCHKQPRHPDPRPGLAAAGERVLPVISRPRGPRGRGASPRAAEAPPTGSKAKHPRPRAAFLRVEDGRHARPRRSKAPQITLAETPNSLLRILG